MQWCIYPRLHAQSILLCVNNSAPTSLAISILFRTFVQIFPPNRVGNHTHATQFQNENSKIRALSHALVVMSSLIDSQARPGWQMLRREAVMQRKGPFQEDAFDTARLF